jgi:glycosyltransferase involved in cell wall biosynthesis
LLGRVPHEQIEQLMRAADLFVLGSHREGGNCSLVEALATGLPPIVTDIPSSRSLLGDGAVGVFWERGEPRSLVAALREGATARGAEMRARVRAHFDAHVSGLAIGRKFAAAYVLLASARTQSQDEPSRFASRA